MENIGKYNKLWLANLTPELSQALQEYAAAYGIRWETATDYKPQFTEYTTLIIWSSDWRFTYAPSNYTPPSNIFSNEYSPPVKSDHFIILREWLEAKGKKLMDSNISTKPMDDPYTPEQHKPPTVTPPSQSPYDIMITDITNKVMSVMPRQQTINREEVEQIINERLSKQGRLMITIQDRRKNPEELKDINEPVHCKMPDVIGILKSGCWACAVGPSGSGKTLGALQYAKIANIDIICVKQMSRMLAPHDLIGFIDANGKYKSGAWTNAILGTQYDNAQGVIPNGQECGDKQSIIVIDEMDNANENVIMLVKALPTGMIQMPYGMQRINPNLTVMATMNTWGTGATREYVGRMAQDAALLNEFSFVEWDYDKEFEWQLIENLFHSYKETGDWTLRHMTMLHAMFNGMRTKAESQKVRVIISTRNIINVIKKLLENPTWSVHKVLMMDVYKGLKEEDIKRIECPEQLTKHEQERRGKFEQKAVLKNKEGKDTPF